MRSAEAKKNLNENSRYTADERHHKRYAEYAQRYVKIVPEKDKASLALVKKVLGDRVQTDATLLDVGCATGHFLRYLKALAPNLKLTGIDGSRHVIDQCRKDPELSGVTFERRNVLSLAKHGSFDVVVCQAILGSLGDEEFDSALKCISRVLRPGGSLIVFDFLNPIEQEIKFTEKTREFPNGLTWHVRSYASVQKKLQGFGLGSSNFMPFSMSIDLPKPKAIGSVQTHTIKDHQGRRLSFRGSFFQPWCHMTARKRK